MNDLARLEQTVTLTDQDQQYLAMACEVLHGQAEELVNTWRAVIGSLPHLASAFAEEDGRVDENYMAAVKKRFVQWVIDTCSRPRDRAWLDYQEEIALRHTSQKKNRTDGANTAALVPLRYLLAFGAVIVTTVRPFLARKGASHHDVERMQNAWTKAVFLQLALWSRPYVTNWEW
jgi:Protoglobin